jgi:hypothetical protein
VDRETLVGQAEYDLGRDLGTADRRPWLPVAPGEPPDRMAERRGPDLAEALGEFSRRAARNVGLGRARLVDHVPVRQVPRGEQRCGLTHRRGEREVPGGDDADGTAAGRLVNLRVVRSGQPRGADHDGDAGDDRREPAPVASRASGRRGWHVMAANECDTDAAHTYLSNLGSPHTRNTAEVPYPLSCARFARQTTGELFCRVLIGFCRSERRGGPTSLEDQVQRIMDADAKATPAGVRALTEGLGYVADPIGDIVMPMLAANREAILRIAREMDEVGTCRSSTRIRASHMMATFANRFAKPSWEVEQWE